MTSAMREFRRPRLWLSLWVLAIVAVIVLSLMPPPPMAVPRGFDKVEHTVGYALLAVGAVGLFARARTLWLAAAGMVALGVALEFAQAWLTTTRAGDPFDAACNTLGVVVGLLLGKTPAARWLQRLDGLLR